MVIGVWNLGVPNAASCMGSNKHDFNWHLVSKMRQINEMGFNVLLLQEVNDHWAKRARQVLKRKGLWNLAHNDKKAILAKDSG